MTNRHDPRSLSSVHENRWIMRSSVLFLLSVLPACAEIGGPAHLLTDVVEIKAGERHTCALTSSGGVKCWGFNHDGELGDGRGSDRSRSVDAVGLTTGVKTITAGWRHTCAVTTTGGAKCWGNNHDGQLGDGTQIDRNTPEDVVGLLAKVTTIRAGERHTCALTAAGGVKCRGSNHDGQLGEGTETDQSSPVDVTGLTSGVTAVTARWRHTCALTSAGGVKCWGNNHVGQLGDGTKHDRNTPVDVVGLTNGVKAFSAGWNHVCALTTAGGMKCWGSNHEGQLGDGTGVDRKGPVDVVILPSGITAIATGGEHSCGVTQGAVTCWGENEDGQLGDGTFKSTLAAKAELGD